MDRVIWSVILCLLLAFPRVSGARERFAPSVRALLGNGIGSLASDSLFLWAGTDAGVSKLPRQAVESGDWTTYTVKDGLGGNSISALAVGRGDVWVAAAHDSAARTSEVSDGISVTRDGGRTWTTVTPARGFGLGNTVWHLAVTPDAVWAACWNAFGRFDSGLIRSRDGGVTWESFVPNPFTNGEYTFSVVVDSARVWAGTAGGIGRSEDDGATWAVSTVANGLTGNWAYTLGIQRLGGRRIVWAAAWPADAGQRYGVVRSFNDGVSWTPVPEFNDVQAVDFTFADSTVWVATLTGLWKSANAGATWTRFGKGDGLAETETIAVHAIGDTVWAGTAESGLSATTNGGATWHVIRTSFPTAALGTPARADTIPTYAFPNPFSPLRHDFVRIRYSLSASTDVTVAVYDVADQLVATIVNGQPRDPGEQVEAWDGKNGRGARVANGVYLYRIQTRTGLHAYGKIVVLD